MRTIENCREDRKNQVHWHYVDNLTVTAVQYHCSNISFLVISLFSIIIIITIIIIVKNLHGHVYRYTDITLTTLLLLQFNTIVVIYHFWSSHYSQSSSLSRSSSSSKTCMDIVINIINNYNSSTTRSLSSGKHHLYIISVFTDAG